jgi:hypothetical protein
VSDLPAWNAALADVLLAPIAGPGRAVLLACDDQAVAAAGARLDVPREQATDALLAALCAAYQVSTQRGLTGAAAQVRPFVRAGRPRPVPPFLAALGVCVLAASRMNRDDRLSSRAYYARLAQLLGIELLDGWPPVAGFRGLVEGGMSALRAWMAGDEAAGRGELLLPEHPSPKLVGIPISQTLLRGRDRELLGTFFAAHDAHLRAGYDPVRLLLSWGGRERLTQHAQEVLGDDALREALAAAIRSALAAWDGSYSDPAGRRLLPGLLHLSAVPGRVSLRLAVPALSAPAAATGPSGQPVALRAYPDAAGLPLTLLDDARDGAAHLTLADRGEAVIAIGGHTILFALGAGGLEQASDAGEEPVWVLTCDPALLARVGDGPRRFGAPLPTGWGLLVDVKPDELPQGARVSDTDGEPVAGAVLAGGLALGAGAWLVDFPPRLLSDLPEPAPLAVDGADCGYSEPGEPISLRQLAGREGAHTVTLAAFELEFELRDRGLRAGTGGLAHHPEDPRLLRAGAVADKLAAGGQGARVCGAQITGGPPVRWRAPLLVTYNATVHVIYRHGTTGVFAPQEPPLWLEQVGLAGAATRWEIPDGDDAVWLCVASDPHPRVIARQAVDVPATDAVLDVVERFADDPVIGNEQDRARWGRLLTECFEEEGAGAP